MKKWKVLLTSGYILFIYLTLPIIRVPQRYLKKLMGEAVFGWSIIGIYILIGLALIYYFFKNRFPFKSWLIFCVAIIASFFLLQHCSTPEEKIHLIEYGLLSIMIYWTLSDICSSPKSQMFAIILVFSFGYVDELIQWVLPNRVYDNWDVLLNGLSGMVGQMIVSAFLASDSKSN